jgi:hypothetical protein
MTARLTLRECASMATCSLAVGESVGIPREGVSLGTRESHHVQQLVRRERPPVAVDVSAPGFTRGPWSIAPIGTGHRLLMPATSMARINGSDVLARSVVLRPGDRISPGVGVVFEYVDVDAAPVVFDIVGRWLLLNAGRLRCWRAVPLDDVGAAPVAAALRDDGGPLLHSVSRGVVFDGDRRVEFFDDCAGVAVDDVIEASIAAGGCADPAIAAALVLPGLAPEPPPHARSVVGFDGVVRAVVGVPAFRTRRRPVHARMHGAVDLIQLLTPHEAVAYDDDHDPDRVADALARDHQGMLSMVKRAHDVAAMFPALARDLAGCVATSDDGDPSARAGRILAWATQEARRASPRAIQSLLEGLCAADCEAERRLREELGVVDVDAIAARLRS